LQAKRKYYRKLVTSRGRLLKTHGDGGEDNKKLMRRSNIDHI